MSTNLSRSPIAAMTRARIVCAAPHQTDGAARVDAHLRRGGERQHGCKPIARLMQEAGLAGASHRPGAMPTTRRDYDVGPAFDLMNRSFTAPGRNHLWVVDTSHMPAAAGFRDLAIALSARCRKIVGWSMANLLRMKLVLGAMETALSQRLAKLPKQRGGPFSLALRRPAPSTQFMSPAFGKNCGEAGVRASMGSVVDARKYAMAGGLFSPLEAELLARRSMTPQAEAWIAGLMPIKANYNPGLQS